MTHISRLSAVARELTDAAASDVFSAVRSRLAELGVDDQMLRGVLTRVSHEPNGQDELLRFRARVAERNLAGQPPLFERYALLRVALSAVDGVAALPVPEGVKAHLLDEFLWLTRPKERELAWLLSGKYVFSALCKLVTFRRFPAGQLHWEVDGLPRSSLWRARSRDLPRLVRGIRDLGGFRPAFVPHLAWRQRQIVLSEREHYRSLFLMAAALELQPHILGFVAEAWFYSPETARVSPHLAWAPRLFEMWGGTVVVAGPAGTESGVFEGSRARHELANAGKFRPTLGLVIWPRAAVQRWAAHIGVEKTPDSLSTTCV